MNFNNDPKLLNEIAELRRQNVELAQKLTEANQIRLMLQSILDETTDAIFANDLQGKYLFINKAGAKMVGDSPDNIINQSSAKNLDSDSTEQIRAENSAILEAGKTVTTEHGMTFNNKTYYFSTTKGVYRDADGHPVGVWGISRDLTKRKEIENKLLEYKNIVDTSTDLLSFIDTSHKYVIVNPAYLKHWDYKPAEVIGQSVADIIGKKLYDSTVKQLIERCLDGEIVNYGAWFDTPQYGRLYLSATYIPYRDADQKITGVLVSTRDITKLKSAEEALVESKNRFHELLRNFPNGSVNVLDRQYRFLFADGLSYKKSGIDPKAVLGNQLCQTFPKEIVDTVTPHYERAFKGELVEFDLAYYNEFYHIKAIPLREKDDTIKKILVVALDATDQIKSQKKLRQAVASLEKTQNKLTHVNAQLITLLSAAPDTIVLIDGQGCIVWTNDREETMFGYCLKELVNQPIEILIPKRFHKNHTKHRQGYNSQPRIMGTGQNILARHKDGTEFPVSVRLGPVQNGNEIMTVAIVRDITELKRQMDEIEKRESYEKAIVTSLDDIIFLINDEYQFLNVWTNKPEDLVIPPEQFMGKPIREVMDEVFSEAVEEGVRLAIEDRQSHYFEYLSSSKQKYYSATVNYVMPTDNSGHLLSCIVKDITKRKIVEDSLEKRLEIEKLISRLSTGFVNLPAEDIGTGLTWALGEIGQFSGVDRCFITLFNDKDKTVSITHEWCRKGVKSIRPLFKKVSYEAFPNLVNDLKQMNCFIINGEEELSGNQEKIRQAMRRTKTRSFIHVPFSWQGTVFGFVGFDTVAYERNWSDDDVTFLQVAGGIFSNALKRKDFEQTLRQSEDKFRTIFNSSNDSIFIVDLDGRFKVVNEAACVELGYERAELLNMSIAQINPDIDPKAVSKRMNSIWSAGQLLYESKHQTKTGRIIPVEVSTNLIHFDNQPAILKTARNITKRKRIEAEIKRTRLLLQTVMDESNQIIYIKNEKDLSHVWISKTFEMAVGVPQNEALGKTNRELFGDEIGALLDATDREVLAGNRVEKEEIINNDRFFWTQKFPIALPDGTVYLCGFSTDITERKKVEEDLRAAKNAAEKANQAKSAFLANMSHELRTPLNGILGFAQILQHDTSLSKSQLHGIKTILNSGQHLLALINDILDLAKIEAGKLELDIGPFSLHKSFVTSTTMMRVKANEKQIGFKSDIGPSVPDFVEGDVKRLRQVIINLLGNAIKFTNSGEVNFFIRQIGKKTRFTITDSGVGIAADDIKGLFKPFQQVGKRDYKNQGTGLGLATSQQIVTLMGGSIQVSSTKGEGSEFWFEIELPKVTKYPNDMSLDFAEPTGYRGERKRILIVDDNSNNRDIIYTFLQPLGFQLMEAVDGKDALHKIGTWLPDLVILDLWMPEMDGFETCKMIKSNQKTHSVKIITVSADVYSTTEQKISDLGSDDFMKKPIKYSELITKIGHQLDINWLYKSELSLRTEIPITDVPPPIIIKKFLNAIEMGNITEIDDLIANLKKEGGYSTFTQKVQGLAEEFDLDALNSLLKKFE